MKKILLSLGLLLPAFLMPAAAKVCNSSSCFDSAAAAAIGASSSSTRVRTEEIFHEDSIGLAFGCHVLPTITWSRLADQLGFVAKEFDRLGLELRGLDIITEARAAQLRKMPFSAYIEQCNAVTHNLALLSMEYTRTKEISILRRAIYLLIGLKKGFPVGLEVIGEIFVKDIKNALASASYDKKRILSELVEAYRVHFALLPKEA